jgi:hypothetical protein
MGFLSVTVKILYQDHVEDKSKDSGLQDKLHLKLKETGMNYKKRNKTPCHLFVYTSQFELSWGRNG